MNNLDWTILKNSFMGNESLFALPNFIAQEKCLKNLKYLIFFLIHYNSLKNIIDLENL